MEFTFKATAYVDDRDIDKMAEIAERELRYEDDLRVAIHDAIIDVMSADYDMEYYNLEYYFDRLEDEVKKRISFNRHKREREKRKQKGD